ncbi:MAG: hypothetical protein RQ745_00985, partial [Longimicrobiales bacterium]|nr:hypothetical protein [Longimicrobiales bacterium]
MSAYSSPDPASGTLLRQLRGAVVVLLLAGSILALPSKTHEEAAAFLRGSVLAPFLALNSAVLDARARAIETEALRAVADSLAAELIERTTLE